jgi:hypothetical protein
VIRGARPELLAVLGPMSDSTQRITSGDARE